MACDTFVKIAKCVVAWMEFGVLVASEDSNPLSTRADNFKNITY